jgi:hypothetical protein
MATSGSSPASFRPTSLTFNNHSWRGAKPYNAADIPIPSYMVSPGVDRTVLEQQFAYEWYDQSGYGAAGRNPPFTHASAGRLLPDFTSEGQPRRILRGFIRRSEYDVADVKSSARLYFMFNPENITRDYVSYLDQGALDPFNSVFQSGNLVPPPSFMDFSFSLLFDRQEEASKDGNHPGVFVDYEYFDLVVRNVIPNYEPNGVSTGGSELPDNGVMMINPRDITVVFSPNITVQGRPSNARVTFTKFTHRMIPVRMQIDLTMRVTYFGPMKDMVDYKAEQATTSDTVQWTAVQEAVFTITNEQIDKNVDLFLEKMSGSGLLSDAQIDDLVSQLVDSGVLSDDLTDLWDATMGSSGSLNESIADYAEQRASGTTTIYDGDKRNQLWSYADCSSYVWGIYATHPSKPNVTMGGPWALTFEEKGKGPPSTHAMIAAMSNSPVETIFQTHSGSSTERSKIILPKLPSVMKGDLLFRKAGVRDNSGKGHVAIVYSNNSSSNSVEIVDCYSPGKPAAKRPLSYGFISTDYTECYRPMLGNPNMAGNRTSHPNAQVPD